MAERIQAALSAAGFDTFFDTKDLPPGHEFNARIHAAVDSADIFLFLASPHSIAPGSYSLAELSFAEHKWPKPHGYVLPVLLDGLDASILPAFLRPIGALTPKGNIEAQIVGWMESRAKSGTASDPGILALQEKLLQWSRRAAPPTRRITPRIPYGFFVFCFWGAWVLVIGLVLVVGAFEVWAFGFPQIIFGLAMTTIGVVTILYTLSIFRLARRTDVTPIAVLVLKRESRGPLHVQTLDGNRIVLVPINQAAGLAYDGDIGWAYIISSKFIPAKFLLEFVPAQTEDQW